MGRAAGGPSSRPGSSTPLIENYTTAWNQLNFPRLLRNTVGIAVLSTFGAVVLVDPGRLRLRPVPVPRAQRLLRHPDRHDHPAVPGDAAADLRDLHVARLERDMAAPDHPALLRERLQRVPAAPVLHVDPARARRGRDDRRGRPVPDPALDHRPAVGRRRSPRSACSTSSSPGTTSSCRCSIWRASPSCSRCRSGSSSSTRCTRRQPTLIQASAFMTMVVPIVGLPARAARVHARRGGHGRRQVARPPGGGTEPGPSYPDEGDLGCATATSTTSSGNTRSPARTRRCRGSTTSGARTTSRSSPTPPAGTRSSATPGCDG